MKMTTRPNSITSTCLTTLRRRLLRSCLVPLGVCAGVSHAALAQTVASASADSASDSHSNQLQEVVVTAQKRGENLQAVPIVISALSAKTLADRGIQSAEDLPALCAFSARSPSGQNHDRY